VGGAEPVEADIDALGHAFRGEIEVREIVAAELGAESIAVAGNAFESDAEEDFTHAAAIEGRGIDEIQAAIESDAHAGERFVDGDIAKLGAERGGAETEDR